MQGIWEMVNASAVLFVPTTCQSMIWANTKYLGDSKASEKKHVGIISAISVKI